MKQARLHVLMVGPMLPSGGITRFINGCLEAKMDVEYQVFNTARPPKERITFGQDGYSTPLNAGVRRAVTGAIITAKNILVYPLTLIRSRAQIVHLAGTGWSSFWEFSIYGLIAKQFGRAVIFHFHGPFEAFHRRSSGFAKRLIEWSFSRYDAILVLSEVDNNAVRRFIPPQKVYLVPNGVKAIAGFDSVRDNSEDPIRVFFLGGANPLRKGLLPLIEAANLAAEEEIAVEWTVGGTETARLTIDQHVLHKAKPTINYVGKLSENEKNEWYAQCSVYALPSYDEGMPYSILEAMSFGLAIISTDVGGIPDVVTEGVNGFLLKPGDARGICECVRTLAHEPGLLSKISQNNVETIRDRFSEAATLKRIEAIYQLLVNKPELQEQ